MMKKIQEHMKNSTRCGFCRDVKLGFVLARKHFDNFVQEFRSYRNVCEISDSKEFKETVFCENQPIPKCVADIRKLAKDNYDNEKAKELSTIDG